MSFTGDTGSVNAFVKQYFRMNWTGIKPVYECGLCGVPVQRNADAKRFNADDYPEAVRGHGRTPKNYATPLTPPQAVALRIVQVMFGMLINHVDKVQVQQRLHTCKHYIVPVNLLTSGWHLLMLDEPRALCRQCSLHLNAYVCLASGILRTLLRGHGVRDVPDLSSEEARMHANRLHEVHDAEAWGEFFAAPDVFSSACTPPIWVSALQYFLRYRDWLDLDRLQAKLRKHCTLVERVCASFAFVQAMYGNTAARDGSQTQHAWRVPRLVQPPDFIRNELHSDVKNYATGAAAMVAAGMFLLSRRPGHAAHPGVGAHVSEAVRGARSERTRRSSVPFAGGHEREVTVTPPPVCATHLVTDSPAAAPVVEPFSELWHVAFEGDGVANFDGDCGGNDALFALGGGGATGPISFNIFDDDAHVNSGSTCVDDLLLPTADPARGHIGDITFEEMEQEALVEMAFLECFQESVASVPQARSDNPGLLVCDAPTADAVHSTAPAVAPDCRMDTSDPDGAAGVTDPSTKKRARSPQRPVPDLALNVVGHTQPSPKQTETVHRLPRRFTRVSATLMLRDSSFTLQGSPAFALFDALEPRVPRSIDQFGVLTLVPFPLHVRLPRGVMIVCAWGSDDELVPTVFAHRDVAATSTPRLWVRDATGATVRALGLHHTLELSGGCLSQPIVMTVASFATHQ